MQRQPDWMAPPENEVGVAFPLLFALARTDQTAVVVRGGVAYSTGLEFRLAVLWRVPPRPYVDPLGHRRSSDEVLRFGVQLADGSKATTVSWRPPPDDIATPVLTQRGSSGHGGSWQSGFWLWPLPPRGAVVFACEWPSEGIPLTRYEIDVSPILEAARRSEVLWPRDDATVGSGAWTTFAP